MFATLLLALIAVLIAILAGSLAVMEMRKRGYERQLSRKVPISSVKVRSVLTVPAPLIPKSAPTAESPSESWGAESSAAVSRSVNITPLSTSDGINSYAQSEVVKQEAPRAMTIANPSHAAVLHAPDTHGTGYSVNTTNGSLSDVGLVREINEDSLIVLEIELACDAANVSLGLYAVADGMGGHAAGEVASRLALTHLATSLLQQSLLAEVSQQTVISPLLLLKQAGQDAARAVYEEARRARTDMGTTLAAAIVDEAYCKVYAINVGDSRVYKINNAGIYRITRDHSLVQRLVDSNQLTPEEARSHPNANLIYRTLGEKGNVEIDTFEQTLKAGDHLLLCTDGLCGLVDDAELQAAVLAGSSPQAACIQLIELAKQAGGYDNVSAIVVSLR